MAEEFQRVAVRPIGVGQGEKIAALGGAGIVDQNIERAEFAAHRRDQPFRRAGLAEIERGDGRAMSRLTNRRRDLVERRRVAAGQHHVAAFGRERERDAAADAAARSGHQRDLAFQFEVHLRCL